jgi:hypothetical protein
MLLLPSIASFVLHWTVALVAAPSGDALVPGGASPESVPAPRLAMNPHLAIGGCVSGGTRIDVGSGTAPTTWTGSFEGELESNAFLGGEGYCAGFLPRHAQFCVQIAAAGSYTFLLTESGGVDTVLAVSRPETQFLTCDDDSAGSLLPMVSAWLEAGEYEIYVGSFSEGERGDFTLQASGGAGIW